MTVLNQTNQTRVSKMVETLGLIRKSAESNKASQEDLWELLSPMITEIETLLDPDAKPTETPAPSEEPKTSQGSGQARWHQIMEWAQSAPLNELRPVVYQYMDRVDDALKLKP